jgi:hypothetical protein
MVLLELLDVAASLNVTDPRDKIFALLGIAEDTSKLGLAPNYFLSTAYTFSYCTKQLISTSLRVVVCVSYAFGVLGVCVMVTSALLRTETER